MFSAGIWTIGNLPQILECISGSKTTFSLWSDRSRCAVTTNQEGLFVLKSLLPSFYKKVLSSHRPRVFAQGSVPTSPAKPFGQGPIPHQGCNVQCTCVPRLVGMWAWGPSEVHTPGSNSNLLSVLKILNKNSPDCKSKTLRVPVPSAIPRTKVAQGFSN